MSCGREKILQNRLFDHDKIEVIWDNVLDEGDWRRHASRCHRRPDCATSKTGALTDIDADGVFVAIGPRAGGGTGRASVGSKTVRLCVDGAGFDVHQHSRRIRPPAMVTDDIFRPGGHRRGHGLHGGIGGGKVPGIGENSARRPNSIVPFMHGIAVQSAVKMRYVWFNKTRGEEQPHVSYNASVAA